MSSRLRIVSSLVAAALVAGVAGACGESSGEPGFPPAPTVERRPAAESAKRPNIVVIYTDDQEAATFDRRYMPRTMRLLGDGGTVFDDFIVTTPLCCPSRVGFLTGNYAHNHGVYVNKHGYQHIRDKSNTLGVWMQRAGYRTAWIGKFLQGYSERDDPGEPAPGFDEWAVSVRAKYYDWKLFTEDGKVRGGSKPRDYYTDELTRRSVALVESQAQRDRPLFVVVNHLAPHRGKGARGRCAGMVEPAPGDRGRFDGEPLPAGESFNRVDPDKRIVPAERLGADAVRKETARHRCRLESLLGVDRSVGELVRAFERAGEGENTVFVFTSDNGLSLGQHGMTGKGIPYEEGLRVPLAMRVPERLLGGRQVARVTEPTANIDVTATLLELAGASPCVRVGSCRTLDGRSLVDLMAGRKEGWPRDRALLIEGGEDGPCGYRGVRLSGEVLLQFVRDDGSGSCEPTGQPELYDLEDDPAQLHNLVATDPTAATRVEALSTRMERLERCAGSRGRDLSGSGAPRCE